MVLVLPPVRTEGVDCCPCDNVLDACTCEGNGCSVTCRSKESTATLCGFSEFVASTPPKKYRKRKISGVFAQCTYPNTDCSIPTCPGSVTFNASGTFFDGTTYIVSGALTFVGFVGGQAQYIASCGGTITNGGVTSPADTRIDTIFGGAETIFLNGNTKNVNNALGSAAFEVNYAGWNEVEGKCVLPGPPAITVVFYDDWDVIDQYNQDTCALVSVDNSFRESGSAEDCTQPGGTPHTIICGGPTDCYGPPTTTTATLKMYDGPGCTNNGDGTSTKTGTSPATPLKEELSIEDTEADAENRAASGMDWSAPDTCATQTAFRTTRGAGDFSFGFRKVQVRATVGTIDAPLIVGHQYEVHIGVYSRTCCGSGVFIFDFLLIVSFTATLTIETTDWVDIPGEDGAELQARTCSYTDVT